jgi:hypothetical protein
VGRWLVRTNCPIRHTQAVVNYARFHNRSHSEVALTEVIESSEGIEGWGAKTSNDAGSATATCVRPVHVDTTLVVHAGGHGGGRTSRVNSSGSTSSDPDTTVPTTAQQEHACTKALLLRADPADSLGSLFRSFPSQ